ncbi:MAG: phage baseplate assembly protein V [Roseburia sp.]
MNSITDLLYDNNENYDNQKVPGFVQGIVVENNNSKFKGMVKVEFTVWENGKNMCEWVRLLSPYTGKDYGSYVVPEIDEIVLIGFIGGSLKRPFLLGSLYPSSAEIVNESFDDKNLIKHFKTKGGMDLKILDEQGKQSIQITTPKGSQFVIEDEKETCLIADKEKKNQVFLDYKNGEIAIAADKKISIKTGKVEVNLDGNSGKMEIKADSVEIKGSNSVKIEGSTSLNLKGGTAQIEGSQKLTAKGGVQAEISGGMVKIN